MVRTWAIVGPALGLALLLPAASSADWLVTRDGARIETDGPWRIDGGRIVFTLPNGTLSALRQSEVDLEASRRATADAARAPAGEPSAAPPAEPVLVLTQADLPPVSTGDTAEATDEDAPAAPASPLVVDTWRQVDAADGSGMEIQGTVRNNGTQTATRVVVGVRVSDEEGNPASADAFLDSSTLLPGASTAFRAVFPDLFVISDDPVFDVQGKDVVIGAVTDTVTPADDQGDAEDPGPDLDPNVDAPEPAAGTAVSESG